MCFSDPVAPGGAHLDGYVSTVGLLPPGGGTDSDQDPVAVTAGAHLSRMRPVGNARILSELVVPEVSILDERGLQAQRVKRQMKPKKKKPKPKPNPGSFSVLSSDKRVKRHQDKQRRNSNKKPYSGKFSPLGQGSPPTQEAFQ